MLAKSFWLWVFVWGIDAVAMGWGWMYPVKLAIFLVVELGAILVLDARKRDFVWLGVCLVLGPAMEMVVISGGAWSYRAPFLLGIPLWLPVAYGLSGLLLRRLVEGFGK